MVRVVPQQAEEVHREAAVVRLLVAVADQQAKAGPRLAGAVDRLVTVE